MQKVVKQLFISGALLALSFGNAFAEEVHETVRAGL